MQYLNLKLADLGLPTFMIATGPETKTWLRVMKYCAEHENGGRICDAKAWPVSLWQQVCQVKCCEVMGSNPLMHWEGNDLIVHFYPCEQENTTKFKREVGRAYGKQGGIESGKARHAKGKGKGYGEPTPLAGGEGYGEPTRRTGMERNGIGREEEAHPSSSGSWKSQFLAALLETGKFPSLRLDAVVMACAGAEEAMSQLWPEVVAAAGSMPEEHIGNPMAWLRPQVSRLEMRFANEKKKDAVKRSYKTMEQRAREEMQETAGDQKSAVGKKE